MVAVVAAVVIIVVAPLRKGAAESEATRRRARLADLEARKEAKFREIRDAELDFRTRKLSESDWRALDRQLRREAIDLLRELDDLQGADPLP